MAVSRLTVTDRSHPMPSLDPNNSRRAFPTHMDCAELAITRGTASLRSGDFLDAANCFRVAADQLRLVGFDQSALADTLEHHATLAMEAFGVTRQ